MTGAEMGVVRLRTGEPATPETSGGGSPQSLPGSTGLRTLNLRLLVSRAMTMNVFCGFKPPSAWSFHTAAPRDGSIWGPSPA